jgi:hypothetical protein
VLCWATRRYVAALCRTATGIVVGQWRTYVNFSRRGRHVVASVRSRGAEVGGDGVVRLCVCPRQRPAITKGFGVGCIQSSFPKLKSSMHEETVVIE